MIVGIPKETLRHEHRVGLTPFGAARLGELGCAVLVEHDAGRDSHFGDADFEAAGARIVYEPDEIHARADLVCQISRVAPDQAGRMRPGAAVCGFMHAAVMPAETLRALAAREASVLGWEAVEDAGGTHPVRRALSEIAGQLAVQWAGQLLQVEAGGRGIVLGNVPGIAPATCVVLGAGTAGWTAARLALAHRAHVIVLDLEIDKLRGAAENGCEHAVTAVASERNLRRYVPIADVLLGAVAARRGRTPCLVSEDMVASMKPGSVILDLSIDDGGCVETSRPTTLDRPTFKAHGVTHFCVPNMTASVPRTASRAMSLATVPYLARIVRHGFDAAIRADAGLGLGVQLHKGKAVSEAAAAALAVPVVRIDEIPADAGAPGAA
jgi:alanine dehydrogenase